MATNITTKQIAGLLQASVFSVAIDESTDINDVARLAIIVRYCNDDCIYEELCCLVPLLGTTTGQDIFTAFFNYFENQKIDIKKIFCVTTDGARALVGKNTGQTVLELVENWKEFILKLNIFWQDISTETYKYFPNVKMHSNRFTVNKDEFQNYIKTLKEEFSKRCADFQAHESIMPFIIKPDLIDLELISFNLNLFKWMEIDDFEMQLIKLRSSELWKFVELRKTLQGGCSETSTTILNCWCSLPDAKFSSLKKVACALISAFGSTYLCARSEACVKLKVTNYKPDVEQLSKDIQGQDSH